MIPKYIDIHAHVNFKVFEEDHDAVIRRALDSGTWFFNVGTQIDTSRAAIKLAHRYEEGVFAVIGLHPIHTSVSHHDEDELGSETKEFISRGEVFNKNVYRELLKDPKVVAIGECGLDYYHMDLDSIKKQKKAFIEQIELADELKKPLMLHIRNGSTHSSSSVQAGSPQAIQRNAYFDTCELLKKFPKVRGVSHFFAGSIEDMKRFVDRGIYISFAGPITYKPKPEICDYEAVIRETPLDMILTDTDSPYVAPVPYRGKRNEPSYVKEIVKKIALVKNLSEEEVARAVIKNARKLFDI
ncbi:MAG: TatD family hydrolase [Candidatus Paceibacterota bacterium]